MQLINPDASKSPSAREGEVMKLQDQQRAAIEKARQHEPDQYEDDVWDGPEENVNGSSRGDGLHPDLQDLSFGPLGKEAG